MASITLSVSTHLSDWVDRQVGSGPYADAGDYPRELIRRDLEDNADRAAHVAALERGEASGISARRVPDILSALRKELGGTAG